MCTAAQDTTDTAATDTAPPEEADDCTLTESDAPDIPGYSPVVLSTCPRAGQVDVDPGLTEIRIAFSKDMQDGSWSWVQADNNFPDLTEVYYESDRVHVGLVSLEPGETYAIWLNSAPDYLSFMDTEGNRLAPYLLTFQTAGEE